MLFDSWAGVARVLLVGTLATSLWVPAAHLRQRTRTKLNAFDLVVTVALGSTLATVLLSSSVALAESAVALGLLIFLQYVITWLSVRSPGFRTLIKAEPTLLLHRGRFLEGAMKAERHHARGDPGGAARERCRRPARDRRGRPGNRRHAQRHSGGQGRCGHSHPRLRAPARRCSGVMCPIRENSGQLEGAFARRTA